MNAIETRYLRVPADAASLRDFLALVESDLANPEGTCAKWPALGEDAKRAARLARRLLAKGEAAS